MAKYVMMLLLPAFLVCGCRKHIGSPARQQNQPPELLVSETWSGPATNGLWFNFTYNASNLLSSVQAITWGSGPIGAPPQTWYDTAYTYFEYQDGLVTKSWNPAYTNQYWAYTYGANGQLLQIVWHGPKQVGGDSANPVIEPDAALGWTLYGYDAKGNLVEMRDSTQGYVYDSYELAYNDSNNLTTCINYTFGPASLTPVQKAKYEWTAFDSKNNFAPALNGLCPTFMGDNNYYIYSSQSPNNIVSENYYPLTNAGQPFGSPYQTTYAYEYDNLGYPVKMRYGPWTVSFVYKKI